MRRLPILHSVALILLGCSAAEDRVENIGDFSIADARQLLTAYAAALTTGDTALITPFWSHESVARDGFWLMHAWIGQRLDVSEWPDLLRDVHFEMVNTEPGPHYHSIRIKWVQNGNGGIAGDTLGDMTFYVVQEEGGWVFSNPVDVLTRGWQSRETECFVFRYPPHIDIEDHLAELREMDRECASALRALDLQLSHKMDFYKVRTPEEAGALLLFPPAHGYGAMGFANGAPHGFRLIVSTSFMHPHEMMHLLQAEARLEDVHHVLTEGFAVAFGGATISTPEFALLTSRYLIDESDPMSLRELLTMNDADFFRYNYDTYYLSGSFVRFLTVRFGFALFGEVTHRTGATDDLPGSISEVCGRSIEELEALWHEYLREITAPYEWHAVPEGAESIFAMVDSQRDDVGDGDYSYPRFFEDGVFDLTGFEMFTDTMNMYFRLEYRNVSQAADLGGEQFIPATVIAIHKGGSPAGHRQQSAHGVRFDGDMGYDIKVNVGTAVSVSDEFGRVFFTTPDISGSMADERTNTLEFSLPVALIGQPTGDWRYFVGVGLTSDRVMNFLYGGPAPVYREHPVFVSGGNYVSGNPAFIDILLPEGIDQERLLSDYDGFAGRLAAVPMLGGGS